MARVKDTFLNDNIMIGGDAYINDVPIVDSGSESNGDWIRLENGYQLCMGRFSAKGSPVITLPKPFINTTYYVYVGAEETSSTNATFRSLSATTRTTSTFTRGATGSTYDQNYIAVGKWR